MKIWKWLPLVFVLLFAACRSSKTVTEEPAGKVHSEEVYKQRVLTNAQRANCVTAKVNIGLNALGKQIAVDGRLRMKRDEVVQLSLNFLGFEVGRMEFTPSQVLVVDRVNKQYVRANYSDISFLREAELDFYALQSLFWNELFVPGQQKVASQLACFDYEEVGNYVMLSLKDTPKLVYTFQTQMEQAIINHVTVKGKNVADATRLEWTYDQFSSLDHRYFPTLMSCKVVGLDKDLELKLSLSRLDNDERWSTSTQLSSRYKERRVEDILRQLMAL